MAAEVCSCLKSRSWTTRESMWQVLKLSVLLGGIAMDHPVSHPDLKRGQRSGDADLGHVRPKAKRPNLDLNSIRELLLKRGREPGQGVLMSAEHLGSVAANVAVRARCKFWNAANIAATVSTLHRARWTRRRDSGQYASLVRRGYWSLRAQGGGNHPMFEDVRFGWWKSWSRGTAKFVLM